jgi:hypothetical protein
LIASFQARKRRPAILVAAVVVLVCSVVLATSCRSGPTPPSLVSVWPGLERSAQLAVADGDGVSSFLEVFESFEPEAVAASALEVYADDAQ